MRGQDGNGAKRERKREDGKQTGRTVDVRPDHNERTGARLTEFEPAAGNHPERTVKRGKRQG